MDGDAQMYCTSFCIYCFFFFSFVFDFKLHVCSWSIAMHLDVMEVVFSW